MNSYILLVWIRLGDNNPSLYLIPSGQVQEWVKQSHNRYINGDDLPGDHALFKLNDWLATEQAKNCKIEWATPIEHRISAVYHCGFFD